MPSANLTRSEATARSEIVSAHSYAITIDLTGREVSEPDKNFLSTTELNFSSSQGATHVDLIADELAEATLDGQELPLDTYDGYRLSLPELSPGDHSLHVKAICRYSNSGEGLHRFVDPADEKWYLYTQFETADARRMYANFEQPDQKATFQFTVLAPSHWQVLSNSARPEPQEIEAGFARWEFAATPRISTYITALIAGDYHVHPAEIRTGSRTIPASVVCRQSMVEYLDADTILTTTQRGFEVFEEAFGVDYAFDSYDQIFVPEFNAGAMENAGCVTFRDQYLWRSRVTAREIEARDNTILHELAHMWFGDLVTMKWWDDLWLNESFAEWASHFAAAEIAARYGTGANPWASFSNERKAWAYLQDQLSTTHPIAADMSDLEKVEQNFDGITYAKGASVLNLLVSFVGREHFLTGVGQYFRKHAFGNTTLDDLLSELEAASGRDLSWFAGQWLATAGVNKLSAEFETDDQGQFTSFWVRQEAHTDWPTLRTHRLGIGLYDVSEQGLTRRDYVELDIDGERTEVPQMEGKQRGDVVLLNDGDLTFAKIRLDEQSLATLSEHIDELHDPVARAITWSSMWDAVRDAEVAPQRFVTLALKGIASEESMAAVTTVLGQASRCSSWFMAPELRTQANQRLVTGLAALLKGAEPASDKQTVLARTLVAAARKDLAVELIQGWLEGEEVPPGLAIDTDMRWNIVTALAKLGVADEAVIEAELQRDRTNAGVERAAGARAGMPTAQAKVEAWQLATQDPSVPNETHRSICMGFWRYHQEEVLAPYVERYLDVAGAISRREGTWAQRGYAAISTVLRWLFPDQLIDAELVQRYRDWLETSEPSQQVQRLMSERLDEAERCLAVREVSRHEGA